jgi:hypothetical protein
MFYKEAKTEKLESNRQRQKKAWNDLMQKTYAHSGLRCQKKNKKK